MNNVIIVMFALLICLLELFYCFIKAQNFFWPRGNCAYLTKGIFFV